MKDLVIGLLLGFVVGVVVYFLGDGQLNRTARKASRDQQMQSQMQINMLEKMCPEVVQKAKAK